MFEHTSGSYQSPYTFLVLWIVKISHTILSKAREQPSCHLYPTPQL